MGTETFVQMGTSINGENSTGKNKCQGGRKEFWRHKRRKMKRICCCFGFLLLLNLFVTFCVLFHTGAILHEVHELKDMDSKSFCSSFCMDFCEDNECDDLYTCRELCQTNVQSTLGSIDSSDEVEDNEETTVDDAQPVEDDVLIETDEDSAVNDEDNVDEPPKLGGDEDYQQHGNTEQQQNPQQVSSNSIVSGTENLPATDDTTTDDTTTEETNDVDEDIDDESTTGDGRGQDGRRHHRPNGQGENGQGSRGHGRGEGGRHRGNGGRFKRFRHH